MRNKFKLNLVNDKFNQLKKDLPKVLANDSLRYFDNSFKNQSWDGKRWQKLKKPRNGGTILVKSGKLRRSIRTTNQTFNLIKIISDLPYSQIHNEGFKGTERVKSYKRRLGLVKKTGAYKASVQVKGYLRKMNMPKRQFMGDSKILSNLHYNKIISAINSCFK